VRHVRSVTDAKFDRSTWNRDVENFNLISMSRARPLLGTGFGHPYTETVRGDNISWFREYRFLPHNSILGIWAFGGLIGFTGLWATPVVGMLLAARSYLRSRSPEQRVTAFAAIASIMIYVLHCWGDIGFVEKKSIFLVGPALAGAAQLAVTTGAWRLRMTGPAGRP
jgi:O-antigen ligase